MMLRLKQKIRKMNKTFFILNSLHLRNTSTLQHHLFYILQARNTRALKLRKKENIVVWLKFLIYKKTMSINHNLGRESSPVAVDTLILDNSEEFQSALASSKSGIDRASTTKIVKLNTEINFFIKNSQYI